VVEGIVSDHKFKVGQTVNYVPHFGGGPANSAYTITQLLPPDGGDFQYRIKSADEPHQRVAKESQLELFI
jgi:hypothetical protein